VLEGVVPLELGPLDLGDDLVDLRPRDNERLRGARDRNRRQVVAGSRAVLWREPLLVDRDLEGEGLAFLTRREWAVITVSG
jgi:hypothetical protein